LGLGQIFEYFQIITKTPMNIEANWPALQGEKVNDKTQVSVTLHDIKLSKVLDVILDQADDGKLGYAVQKGTVVISTKEDLRNRGWAN
jgi:hypothetical protein